MLFSHIWRGFALEKSKLYERSLPDGVKNGEEPGLEGVSEHLLFIIKKFKIIIKKLLF
jgi:hypothetical protein